MEALFSNFANFEWQMIVMWVIGGVLIFLFEYHNPLTIGELSLFDKLQVSFFQSVTTRTAGFASVPQENLRDTTSIISMAMMLVGGSPVGTAGGLKTVTIAVLLCSAFATVRNKSEATLFGRRISSDSIRRAVAVIVVFGCFALVSTTLLAAATASSSQRLFSTVEAWPLTHTKRTLCWR